MAGPAGSVVTASHGQEEPGDGAVQPAADVPSTAVPGPGTDPSERPSARAAETPPVGAAAPSATTVTAGAAEGTGMQDGKVTVARVRAAGPTQEHEEETEVEMTVLEQGEAAKAFVQGLVERMGVPAQVAVHQVDDETVTVTVDGEHVGPLIGHGGATLAALQELTRTYVQKLTGGQSERVVVDVAGYRERRTAALQRFTRQVAEQVKASGQAQALEPMGAADRKVVHDTVNEIAGVTTRSEGEDPRRYIVIQPTTEAQD